MKKALKKLLVGITLLFTIVYVQYLDQNDPFLQPIEYKANGH